MRLVFVILITFCLATPCRAGMVTMLCGGTPVAAAGCSGSYGNQSATNAGLFGTGTTNEILIKVTGACNGAIASITPTFNDLIPDSADNRASVVIRADSGGAPGALIASAVVTGASISSPTARTTTITANTGATTYWIGVYAEQWVTLEHSGTTGGTTAVAYNCSAAYNAPPATFGSGCSIDHDEDAYQFKVYVTH
jgi:hypothetical protein